jgi:hypothetical protein
VRPAAADWSSEILNAGANLQPSDQLLAERRTDVAPNAPSGVPAVVQHEALVEFKVVGLQAAGSHRTMVALEGGNALTFGQNLGGVEGMLSRQG